eukprot:scpid92971/ scgid24891/ 
MRPRQRCSLAPEGLKRNNVNWQDVKLLETRRYNFLLIASVLITLAQHTVGQTTTSTTTTIVINTTSSNNTSATDSSTAASSATPGQTQATSAVTSCVCPNMVATPAHTDSDFSGLGASQVLIILLGICSAISLFFYLAARRQRSDERLFTPLMSREASIAVRIQGHSQTLQQQQQQQQQPLHTSDFADKRAESTIPHTDEEAKSSKDRRTSSAPAVFQNALDPTFGQWHQGPFGPGVLGTTNTNGQSSMLTATVARSNSAAANREPPPGQCGGVGSPGRRWSIASGNIIQMPSRVTLTAPSCPASPSDWPSKVGNSSRLSLPATTGVCRTPEKKERRYSFENTLSPLHFAETPGHASVFERSESSNPRRSQSQRMPHVVRRDKPATGAASRKQSRSPRLSITKVRIRRDARTSLPTPSKYRTSNNPVAVGGPAVGDGKVTMRSGSSKRSNSRQAQRVGGEGRRSTRPSLRVSSASIDRASQYTGSIYNYSDWRNNDPDPLDLLDPRQDGNL